MTATDIENFSCAVGALIDGFAAFRKTVAYQGAIAAMQAENAARAVQGMSPANGHMEFYNIAKEFGFAPHDQ